MRTTKDCPVCDVTFTRVHTSSKPPAFCSRACANKAPGRMTPEIRAKISRRAENHPNWTGGRWVANRHGGRVFIRVPDGERHLHLTMRRDGYIRRYHYVWNTHHPDDPVRRGDVVLHLNGDPTDDRIENLEKTVQSEHARHHGVGQLHTPEARALMSRVQRERRVREGVDWDQRCRTTLALIGGGGRMPSLAEIGAEIGGSRAVAFETLQELVQRGCLRRHGKGQYELV